MSDYHKAYSLLRYHNAMMCGWDDENWQRPLGSIFTVSNEALGAAMKTESMRNHDDLLARPFWSRCLCAKWQGGKVVYDDSGIPF